MSRLTYISVRKAILKESLIRFWRLFRKNKKGMTGLALLVYITFTALAAPILTEFDPDRDTELADPMVPPEWAVILPGYDGLPPNILRSIGVGNWQLSSEGGIRVDRSEALTLSYAGDGGRKTEVGQLSYVFDYPASKPSKSFVLTMNITFANSNPFNLLKGEGLRLRLRINMTRDADGASFILHDGRLIRDFTGSITVHSRDQRLLAINRLGHTDNLANVALTKPGNYRLAVYTYFEDSGGGKAVDSYLKIHSAELKIRGRVFGLLGTDYLGRDVWTLFVWGARPALLAGIMVGVGIIGLGVVIGLSAGYRGGFQDRALMFFGDTMNLLPALPLILLSILLFGRNLWIILLVIIIFGAGYAGLARQLRAWVLSLKERPFVESARAAGCSDRYIMYRYILPHTAPLLMYVFVLSIPSGILTIFALELLGLGDPAIPSWGRTLGEAWSGGAVLANAWWWLGMPITALFVTALGFVLVGYALDEIVNPRLRMRSK